MDTTDSDSSDNGSTPTPPLWVMKWFARGLVVVGLILLSLVFYRYTLPNSTTSEVGELRSITDRGPTHEPSRSAVGADSSSRLPSSRLPGGPTLRGALQRLKLTPVRPRESVSSIPVVDLEGTTHRLNELRGKWVLVNFWATWCPPCTEEMPSMERLWNQLRDRRFVLVGVNLGESTDTVQSFREKHRLTFPIWVDREGTLVEAFRLRGVPTSWIVSPEGEILGRVRGPREWDQDPARTVFKRLLRYDSLAEIERESP